MLRSWKPVETEKDLHCEEAEETDELQRSKDNSDIKERLANGSEEVNDYRRGMDIWSKEKFVILQEARLTNDVR